MIGDSPVLYTEYGDFVRESFRRAALRFSGHDLPYATAVDSATFFEHWGRAEMIRDVFGRDARCGGPLSFCYIDGLHDYRNARLDFLNCDDHLVVNGLILFDDSSAVAPHDLNRLVKDILRSGRYELVDRNPNYLIRKVA
jgi:hypothetical protein